MNSTDSSLAMNAICYAASAWQHAGELAQQAVLDHNTPFATLKPRMFPDGNQWCALYGDNLQEGVAGFGGTPEKAQIAFDLAWLNSKLYGSKT